MNNALLHRPEWEIDKRLQSLLGENVRVAAESFSPLRWNGEALPEMIRSADIILPDNSQPAGLPVLFEGKLQQFERRVGVVYVRLNSPSVSHESAQGWIHFRGRNAVILSGPATVKLAFPHVIERVPANEINYWNDLRFPQVQLELQIPKCNEK